MLKHNVRIIWLHKAGETTHAYEEKRAVDDDNNIVISPANDKARRRVLRASGKASSERTTDNTTALSSSTSSVSSALKPSALQAAASTGRVKVRKSKRTGSKSAADDVVAKEDTNNNNNNNNGSTPINIHEPPTVKLVSFADIMAKMQEKQALQSVAPTTAAAPSVVDVKKQDDVVNVAVDAAAPAEPHPAPVVVVQEPAVVPPVDIVDQLHHVVDDAPATAVSAPVTPKKPVSPPPVNAATEPPAAADSAAATATTTTTAANNNNHRPRRATMRTGTRPDANKEWLVQFVDLDAAEAARDRVLGADAGATWALFTYSAGSSSAIELEATGNNCASLRQRFDSRRAQYALLRWTQKSSGSTLTKFVAIHWQGAQLGTLAKARSATHKSSLRSFFRNVHVDIAARALGDVTDDAIANAVLRGAGGQAAVPRVSPRIVMHTMHREPSSADQKEQKLAALEQLSAPDGGLTSLRRTVSNSGASATAAGDAKLAAEIVALQKAEGELELVGQAFASESTGPCWVACGLKGAAIVEVGSGASGVAGITAALRERAQVADAALLFLRARQPSTYGQLQQRTALIEFVSSSVRPVQRARMQPDRQRARNLFGHHNVYLEVFSEADLSTLEEKLVAAMSKH